MSAKVSYESSFRRSLPRNNGRSAAQHSLTPHLPPARRRWVLVSSPRNGDVGVMVGGERVWRTMSRCRKLGNGGGGIGTARSGMAVGGIPSLTSGTVIRARRAELLKHFIYWRRRRWRYGQCRWNEVGSTRSSVGGVYVTERRQMTRARYVSNDVCDLLGIAARRGLPSRWDRSQHKLLEFRPRASSGAVVGVVIMA